MENVPMAMKENNVHVSSLLICEVANQIVAKVPATNSQSDGTVGNFNLKETKPSFVDTEGHAFKDSDNDLINDQLYNYSDTLPAISTPCHVGLQLIAPARAEVDYNFRLILVGDSGVGKSKLLLRFSDGTFTSSFISTIGIDFKIRTIELDGKQIKLQIWNTAGQERFRTITTAYYREAMDITMWKRSIEHHNKDANMILVGNGTDMDEGKRVVHTSRGRALADEHGIKFFETCAETNLNVHEVFFSLTREIIRRLTPKIDDIPKEPAPEIKRHNRGPLGFARELFSKKKER
uniref:Uncharacterized protein n=1 Tax=Avena sativa TaxID=4498 RepID=A0ACD5XZR9_AVESA